MNRQLVGAVETGRWRGWRAVEFSSGAEPAVDPMVANEGRAAGPVKPVSRRRRGPQARLDRAWRSAILVHRGRLRAVVGTGACRAATSGGVGDVTLGGVAARRAACRGRSGGWFWSSQ